MWYGQAVQVTADQVVDSRNKIGRVAFDDGPARVDGNNVRSIVTKQDPRPVLQFTSPAPHEVKVAIVKIDVPLVLHNFGLEDGAITSLTFVRVSQVALT